MSHSDPLMSPIDDDSWQCHSLMNAWQCPPLLSLGTVLTLLWCWLSLRMPHEDSTRIDCTSCASLRDAALGPPICSRGTGLELCLSVGFNHCNSVRTTLTRQAMNMLWLSPPEQGSVAGGIWPPKYQNLELDLYFVMAARNDYCHPWYQI